MGVRGSRSNVMGTMESALDDNEEYIGPKVFKELEDAFNRVDDLARNLEDELDESNERIADLERKIEELEADR